jgi:hypothetical protein
MGHAVNVGLSATSFKMIELALASLLHDDALQLKMKIFQQFYFQLHFWDCLYEILSSC